MYEERTKLSEEGWYDVTYSGVGTAPDGNTRPVSPVVLPTYRNPVRVLYERYTPNSGGNQREWKDFEHYKCTRPDPSVRGLVRQVSDSYVAGIDVTNPVYTVGIHPNPYAGADPSLTGGLPMGPSLLEPSPDGHFVPLPGDLSAMEAAAYARFIPEMRSNLSIVNSLIELKDLSSLKQSVTGSLLKLRQLYALIGPARLRILQNPLTFKELAKQLADDFLQWKFNIKPLISDIRGIYTSLSQLERRINDLVSRANRPLISYYKYEWVEFDDGYYDHVGPSPHGFVQYSGQPWWYGQTRLHTDVSFRPTKFHAVMSYSYYYPYYTLVHARTKGLLDALGVQLNPAIIWNAIRWTFVIDWVIGVSRFLDSLKVRWLEPVINIRDYSVSVLREKQILQTSYTCSGTALLGAENVVSLPVIRETAYRRFIKMPTKSSLVASGLNSSEFTLGAALVISRRRRARSRSR